MIFKKTLAVAILFSLSASAWAGCAFQNTVPVKSLSAGFEAWKVVTAAMAECGNVESALDQDFKTKQPVAFSAKPALYQLGGVSNGTMVPLLAEDLIRPVDDLVAKYGRHLKPNQLIKIDGKVMAIAMAVNAQHLMYRSDVLSDLGIAVPKTYDEVLAAAEKIKKAGVVEYPLGGTYKSGWNLALEFINMNLGNGGSFFADGNKPDINNEIGVASLEMMKKLSAYMDPEFLVSDSTYVQQQFQQGKIAIANLWATRAGAMNEEKESTVVGKVKMASAPKGTKRPASTLWWDGFVFAKNTSDEQADAAFRVAMEGMDSEMVQGANDVAVWLVDGFKAGDLAQGAIETAQGGTVPYPASKQMGIMHTALGSGLAAYLAGDKDVTTTLADIEVAYTTTAKEAGLIK
jgi:multiple sugar transport system substrate-binding protein